MDSVRDEWNKAYHLGQSFYSGMLGISFFIVAYLANKMSMYVSEFKWLVAPASVCVGLSSADVTDRIWKIWHPEFDLEHITQADVLFLIIAVTFAFYQIIPTKK